MGNDFSYSGSCGDEGIGATNNGAVLRLEDRWHRLQAQVDM